MTGLGVAAGAADAKAHLRCWSAWFGSRPLQMQKASVAFCD